MVSLATFVAVWFVLFGLVVIVVCSGWCPKDSWLPYVYWVKCKIASQTESPKIVIMGGSASTFGIDSGIIKKETGRPVVNMAMHAGFPLRVYLSMVDRYVGTGDVVVLPLELTHYSYGESKIYSDFSLTYLLGIAPEFQQSLTARQFMKLYLCYGFSWLSRRLSSIDDRCFYHKDMECAYLRGQLIRAKGEEQAHYEYGIAHLNEYGDTMMPIGQFTEIRFLRCENSISSEFLEAYAELHALIKKKGATLIVTYPNLFQCENDPTLPKLVERLASNGVDIVGDPYLISFPANYYYDTSYHLNAYGARLYTSVLSKIICSHLKIAIPEQSPECQILLKSKCEGKSTLIKRPLSFASHRWCCYITLNRDGKNGKMCHNVLVNDKSSAYSEVEYTVKNVVKVLLPKNLEVAKITIILENDCAPTMERILLECPDFVPQVAGRAQ